MDQFTYQKPENPFNIKLILIGILAVIVIVLLYLRNRDKNDCESNNQININKIKDLTLKLDRARLSLEESNNLTNTLTLKLDRARLSLEESNNLTNTLTSTNSLLESQKQENIKLISKIINNISEEIEKVGSKQILSVEEALSIKELNISLITLVGTAKALYPNSFKDITTPNDKSNIIKRFFSTFSIDNKKLENVNKIIIDKVEPLIEKTTVISINNQIAPEIKLLFQMISKAVVDGVLPKICQEITTQRKCDEEKTVDCYNDLNGNEICTSGTKYVNCRKENISVDDFRNMINQKLQDNPVTKEDIDRLFNELGRKFGRPFSKMNEELNLINIDEQKYNILKIMNYFIGKVFPDIKISNQPVNIPENPTVNVDYIVNIYSEIRNTVCNTNDPVKIQQTLEYLYSSSGVNF